LINRYTQRVRGEQALLSLFREPRKWLFGLFGHAGTAIIGEQSCHLAFLSVNHTNLAFLILFGRNKIVWPIFGFFFNVEEF
jgi:hypothetical protein